MMEEIKELLHLIEKIPSLTLWILGGFGVYKLVMYLSTTGAIVLISKLAINKGHDYLTRPERKEFRIGELCMHDTVANQLVMTLSTLERKDRGFLYLDDVKWLQDAINEKKLRDTQAEKK